MASIKIFNTIINIQRTTRKARIRTLAKELQHTSNIPYDRAVEMATTTIDDPRPWVHTKYQYNILDDREFRRDIAKLWRDWLAWRDSNDRDKALPNQLAEDILEVKHKFENTSEYFDKLMYLSTQLEREFCKGKRCGVCLRASDYNSAAEEEDCRYNC